VPEAHMAWVCFGWMSGRVRITGCEYAAVHVVGFADGAITRGLFYLVALYSRVWGWNLGLGTYCC
jgi:ketosteroid isomerase-like protein